MSQINIFSRYSSKSTKKVETKKLPLRIRILEFFKEHKYQSFTPPEVPSYFPSHDPKVIRKAIAQLENSRHLVATGARKNASPGIEDYYITLNLHRR
jgi:hypothetical protein